MTVGIVGLGLIGGSMAKAYSAAGHRVYGWDLDGSILEFAALTGAHQGTLDKDTLPLCDLVLLAVPPQAAIDWLRAHGAEISPDALVMDLCGTKRVVCASCFPLAERYGFTFVGGHPMAGTHNSGFKYSRADMFDGAPMVIVPPTFDDIELLDRVKALLQPARFGRISAITAQEHDKRIAFTSQLAHVVSNAYVKSPTAREHAGFSAGSYKDLTRVAWLNPDMWAELFLENKEHLLFELNTIIENLTEYKTAMEQDDFSTLRQLLDDGRRIKEEVDGH